MHTMGAKVRLVLFVTLLGWSGFEALPAHRSKNLVSVPQQLTEYDLGYSRASESFDHSSVNQGPMQNAVPGDIATGRLIREENKELDLDASPCSGDRVVRFHDPYKKTVVGTLKCGEKTVDRIQVQQK